jgi:hypothetical protein
VDEDGGVRWTKMAGVRMDNDEITPIAMPRGLPEDVSLITRLDRGRDDGHSDSWLSSKEIWELECWVGAHPEWFPCEMGPHFAFTSRFGYLFENLLSQSSLAWLEDFRFVFWFDN